ncbi:MAG: hypothetical protein HYS18_07520 [Burkholderiales bacterium]|nr:hypothetical protein [Burkholderiales bacterium]
MINKIKLLSFLLLAAGSQFAFAADPYFNVGVAGQISPGVYGRIEVGNTPPPVVYAQPIIIAPSPRPVVVAPIYMNVPPGHAKKWSKHCHKYHACGQPVYFVRTAEYGHEGHGKHKGKHKD